MESSCSIWFIYLESFTQWRLLTTLHAIVNPPGHYAQFQRQKNTKTLGRLLKFKVDKKSVLALNIDKLNYVYNDQTGYTRQMEFS